MSVSSPTRSATAARFQFRTPSVAAPIVPSAEQRRVIEWPGGRLRVLAGPGTGKTATLVEAVAERIRSGQARPDQILVLTYSRRAAGELADRIGRRVGATTREPMVRTLHSYAFALLRSVAAAAGQPAPRLLGGGESDQMVRELLAGHQAAGGGPWPAFLHPALGSPTFAAELRDLLLRCAERAISPARMIEWGRRRQRPEWTAAGRFAREYQQVGDLRQISGGLGVALDQAELTVAALAELHQDSVLAREQQRIRRVFVDEYQDVDPAQSRLVELLGSGADELVVVGDPDQAIYQFRGSDPGALRDFRADETVALTVARRLPAELVTATRRVARLLPGPGPHRGLSVPEPGKSTEPTAVDPGRVEPPGSADPLRIAVLAGEAQQASYIADQLRRAHLLGGVSWSEMAVVVRSPAAQLSALSRAFATAGVPISVAGADLVFREDPTVAALLEITRSGLDPDRLTGDLAVELLAAPIGGLDPLALRRLRRGLRAAAPGAGSGSDLLAGLLAGSGRAAGVPADTQPAVERVASMVALARQERSASSAEDLLWSLWRRSGLESGLVATSERGGRAGQRADRTLDAVVALFDLAADVAERLPAAGLRGFLASAQGEDIGGRRVGGASEAVTLLSAHAAKGLEWDVVVVAGVQEGRWPDLGRRDTVLHGPELLDLAGGAPAGLPDHGTALAQERRLFYVAATRARVLLICTAVAGQDTEPSRFLGELAGGDQAMSPAGTGVPAGNDGDAVMLPEPGLEVVVPDPSSGRQLHLTDLIAELRSVVSDPGAHPDRRRTAADHLAELADNGVRGADPADWYGVGELSCTEDVIGPGAPVALTSSAVEGLLTCPLRAVLERRGGGGPLGDAQIEGIAAHALAHGLALGVSPPDLQLHIEEYVDGQEHLPPWQRRRVGRVLAEMSESAQVWHAQTHPPRTLLGAEVDLDVVLPAAENPSRGAAKAHLVRVAGRVDWLSKDPDGSIVVTDFKTAAAKVTVAKAREHPQLATYQVAIAAGAFDHLLGDQQPALDRAAEPTPDLAPIEQARGRSAGAELVYLRGGVPKTLGQPALSDEQQLAWSDRLRSAASSLASGTLLAQQNERCERCPVRGCCPVQGDGLQVTR